MSDQTYNGWTNKPTWLFNLWMTNSEGDQEWLDNEAQEACRDALADAGTKDDAVSLLAAKLEGWLDEYQEQMGTGLTGMLSDLMSWATAMIDWDELAENYIDEAWDIAVQEAKEAGE